MRVRIEYGDHNEKFRLLLPRAGVIEQGLQGGWHLLRLDQPIEYALRDGPEDRYPYLLIRSRWEGHEVGTPSPTSVFVYLVKSGKEAEGIAAAPEASDPRHVAWGTSHTLP